jgi:hypothetical protein
MTLLLRGFVVVEGKTAGAVKTGGASRMTQLGIVARALNEPRNLTSTTATPQKTTLKITTKNREENNDEIRRNLLTLPPKKESRKFTPSQTATFLSQRSKSTHLRGRKNRAARRQQWSCILYPHRCR